MSFSMVFLCFLQEQDLFALPLRLGDLRTAAGATAAHQGDQLQLGVVEGLRPGQGQRRLRGRRVGHQ